MPPIPNETFENSPHPSRPIEERSKRIPLPVQNEMSRTFPSSNPPETSNSEGRPPADGVFLDTGNLKLEIERLRTFEGWGVPFLSAGQMAAAGFYYMKQGDYVKCAFCGVEVGSWVEGDNPMSDHRRWSPACGFLRKLQVGNVPINPETGMDGQNPPRENGYDVCGTGQYGIVFRSENKSNLEIPSIEKLGIQQSRPPTFPLYSTFEARLRSYETWPISLKLKPKVLSEAGFFYTGKGDQTICYHCGGGLKDWEESDDPWEEHARWFNKCSLVLLVKGKGFIEKVNNSKKPDITSFTRDLKNGQSSNMRRNAHSLEQIPDDLENETAASTSSGVSSSDEKCSIESSDEAPNEKKENVNSDSRLCKICFTEEMGVLFLPCGHIVACPTCALSLTTCAICRKPFTATVRAFLS